MITARRLSLLLASVVLSASSTPANVLTVGSGGAYADIDTALFFAADGDVILVSTGTYAGFTIGDKSLTVTADAGASVSVTTPITLGPAGASRSIVLSGLELNDPFGGSAIRVTDVQGSVRLQSITVSAASYVFASNWFALDVAGSADVALVQCTLVGRDGGSGGFGFGHGGEAAIRVSSSNLAMYECQSTGGRGRNGYINAPSPPVGGGAGAPAVLVTGGSLFARGSTFEGGEGGNGHSTNVCPYPYDFPTAGGAGGPGVYAVSAATSMVDVSAQGGAGGTGGIGGCGSTAPDGARGAAFSPSSIVPIAAPHVAMSVIAPAREGAALDVHVIGPAGARAVLATSLRPGHAPSPATNGVLLLQPPLRRVELGTIPASGTLSTQLLVPDLGSMAARVLHAQASFIGPSGVVQLSSPSVLVMLDSAY